MNDISDLYNVIKNFLPLADKYLSGSPIEPYLPEIQNIINQGNNISVVLTKVNNMYQQAKISIAIIVIFFVEI